ATRALRREAGGPGLAVVGVALVHLSPISAEYRGTLAKGAVVLAAVDRGQISGREVVVASKNCLRVLAPAIGRDASNPVRLVVAPSKRRDGGSRTRPARPEPNESSGRGRSLRTRTATARAV